MKKSMILCVLAIIASVSAGTNAFSREYEVPPTRSTSADVPYISDAAMERCVKIYNQAKWLREDLQRAKVNQYSKSEVNAYNSAVNRLSAMTDDFNENCAGKQSESAYRAAQKLNQKR